MAVRYYLSDLTGDGLTPETAFRPRAAYVLVPGIAWAWIDGRADGTAPAGRMLCWADVTAAQHATLTADAGITYVPFETAGGTVITTAGTVSQVSAANRTAISNRLEAQGIPTDDFAGTDTIARVLRRVVKRYLARHLLAADDWTEGLDTLVSAMDAAKRQRVNARLTALGFDTSTVLGSDTIRAAVKKILAQGRPLLASPWEALP